MAEPCHFRSPAPAERHCTAAAGYCNYCYVFSVLQAQEELLDVPWPKKLLEHPYCASVRLGAVSAARNPEAAADVLSKGGIPLDQQGPLVMSGLRVRMGIGTGVPDDIFVHDLTEHVEYRGALVEMMIADPTLTTRLLRAPA